MKARALRGFSGYGITASNGEVIEIQDERIFLDLAQAGFVEQVDRKATKAEVKSVIKAEANQEKQEK